MSFDASSPTNINRNPPPSNRQLLILLTMFLGFVVGVLWLISLLVDNLVLLIPPSVEQQIGKLIVPVYERLAKPSSAQDSLNELLNQLENNLPVAQNKQRDYQVLYIQNETVNALAIPGDRIIIYSGLLNKMKSENELMMILGHELGHFAHRDHLRSLSRQIVLQIAIAAFLGDSGAIQSIATSAISAISNAQFSQSQETAADEFGLKLLQKNYGHVAGATDFFTRLSKLQGINIAFLSTHPAPRDRVNKLEKLIKERGYKIGERSLLPAPLEIKTIPQPESKQ